MNELTNPRPVAAPLPAPPAHHGLGPVADDWEAAQVWLRAIAEEAVVASDIDRRA